MSVCNDFIQFEHSEDWERVIGVSKSAVITGERSHVPIPAFDLGVALNESYVVLVVQATDAKPTWIYGGEVRQFWAFPKGGEIGGAYSIAESAPVELKLNRVQAIPLNPNTTDTFRLIYKPPTWFKGVVVIGWKYTGDVANFTKDTLFDIGNKVGIGTLDDPTSIPNQLTNQQALLETIISRLDALESGLFESDTDSSFSASELASLSSVVSQIVTQTNERIEILSDKLDRTSDTETSSLSSEAPVFPTSLEEEFL